jgi:CheY-like chemotaxis protein
MNIELFKTLNILYVENDEELEKTFAQVLIKLFKKVFLSLDGLDALTQFTQHNNSDEKIDVILSEYNIPSLNGLELLLQVRKINETVPFIFVTQETSIDLLLNSLRYDVTDYFVKPIDEKEILRKIEEACFAKKQEDEIKIYQDEIEEYLELINNVAIVYIFNSDMTISYANNFFLELIKYDEDELVGKDYRDVFHYEMPKAIITEQATTLESGAKWQGKIKYLTSIDSLFYTNCTIIPVFDEDKNITKYISVNFLTTREENEKREFKKKVLFDLQETRRIYSVAQRKINELDNILLSCSDYDEKKENLQNLQISNQNNYNKLQELENKLKVAKDKYDLLTHGINKKISQISVMINEMKDIEERASKKVIKVTDEIKSKDFLITKIKDEIEIKATKIRDFEDVLNHRKSQTDNKKGNN